MRVPSSVRFRVTAMATAVVIIVLVGVGLALVLNQRRTLTESLDETMTGRVDELAGVLAAGGIPSLDHLGDDDTVAQLVSMDGEVLDASRQIGGVGPIQDPIASGEVIRGRDELPGVDGPVRVLSRVVETPDGAVTVHVAASLDDIDENVWTLIAGLLIAIPIAAAVLASLVWFAVGRTLRPVERIRAEVASITGSDLDRRVPAPGTDDEIGELARTMNDMLERLDRASRRQRRFVADASHELRSPLTRMRSELEVDIAHPAGVDPWATHRSVLEEVVGLQRLVDDLLLLARNADAQHDRPDREPEGIVGLAARATARMPARDGVTIDVAVDPEVRVLANASELTRVIGNLLDNAMRHARSVVTLSASEIDGEVVIAVEDDGSGIPDGEHERIFERFARVDEGRSSADGGFGLGLAIARDIVERHRGTLTADPAFRRGARFVVTLPSAS